MYSIMKEKKDLWNARFTIRLNEYLNKHTHAGWIRINVVFSSNPPTQFSEQLHKKRYNWVLDKSTFTCVDFNTYARWWNRTSNWSDTQKCPHTNNLKWNTFVQIETKTRTHTSYLPLAASHHERYKQVLLLVLQLHARQTFQPLFLVHLKINKMLVDYSFTQFSTMLYDRQNKQSNRLFLPLTNV